MSAEAKILLLGGPFPSTAMVFHHLRRTYPQTHAIMEGRGSRWQTFARRRKRFGIANATGQLAFRVAAMPLLSLAGRSRAHEIKREFVLQEAAIPPDALTHVDSVNGAACMKLLKEMRPEVIVVNGTRLISPEILRAVEAPFVNLHSGITPAYRGVHGAYWALAQHDAEHCGVTLHLLDEGIDTGPVLAQAPIHPGPRDNFATYPLLQVAAALPLLDATLPRLLRREDFAAASSNGNSRLWSHPTLGQYLRQRMRGVK